MDIQAVVAEAKSQAQAASAKYFNEQLGGVDQYACGFAWVEVYKVRSNSKVGKELLNNGFRKDYRGALQLWNPSGFGCQNIDTLEAGAQAAAEVLRKAGLEAFAGSRLD